MGREYNTYSKLYYNRARYYAARLGVFISRDPIDIADDVNLYAYVKNRPVMYTDPSGMSKNEKLFLNGDGTSLSDSSNHNIIYKAEDALEYGMTEMSRT